MHKIKPNFDKIFEIVKDILKKERKRNETIFSQLCYQFMMQYNYAKSFTGSKPKIFSKITDLQFLNKFIYNQLVGRVKPGLAN